MVSIPSIFTEYVDPSNGRCIRFLILLFVIQHSFSVVRSAGSTVYNYVNPVRRDVVNTGVAGDNATIRFKTDNAGPWIIHW